MSELSRPFPRLQIALLEGRGQSTRYKQIQFQRLHQALTTSASAIKLAIQADSGHATNEVELEFALALSELRDLYDSLDLAKELSTLRKVTLGQDNLERTKPAGIVYIVPAKWCLFHAVISPLGAALAAGNCVVLELPRTIGHVSSLLRKLLTEGLDADCFAISTSRPVSNDLTSRCVLVLQEAEDIDHSKWSQVLQSPSAGSVVIVDRTADVVKAAETIANVSFAFRGRAPYAPRVVLVNEYICDQFLSRLAVHVTDPKPSTEPELVRTNSEIEPPSRSLQKAETLSVKDKTRRLVAGSNGSVVELLDRDDPLLLTRSQFPTIRVGRISSLDDGINMLAGFDTLDACFVFAGLAEGNYVSTYIDAHLSTINHIPVELLVGPIYPLHPSKEASPFPRYCPSLFARPRPQYLQPKSHLPSTTLSLKHDVPELKVWAAAAIKPIEEIKGPDRFLLNFFGTGIVIGLSTIALSVTGTGAGACWLIYKTYRALVLGSA